MKVFSLNISEASISFCNNFDSIQVYKITDGKIEETPQNTIRVSGMDIERFYLTDSL